MEELEVADGPCVRDSVVDFTLDAAESIASLTRSSIGFAEALSSFVDEDHQLGHGIVRLNDMEGNKVNLVQVVTNALRIKISDVRGRRDRFPRRYGQWPTLFHSYLLQRKPLTRGASTKITSFGHTVP
jgi:hypothetical protein